MVGPALLAIVPILPGFTLVRRRMARSCSFAMNVGRSSHYLLLRRSFPVGQLPGVA